MPVAAPRRTSGGLKLFTLVMLLIFGGLGTAAYLGYQHTQKESAKDDVADGAVPSVPLDGTATSTTVVGAPAGAGIPTPLVALPEINLPRPTYRVAKFLETIGVVAKRDGVTEEYSTVLDVEVDYATAVSRVLFETTGDRAFSGESVYTADSIYTPGEAFGAPWTRQSRSPSPTAVDTQGHLLLYSEYVTPDVRAAATNVTSTSETVHDVAVTTFRFDVDWTKLEQFGGDAATDVSEILNPSITTAHLTISVDAQGFVRVFDYVVDAAASRQVIDVRSEDGSLDTHLRVEVLYTSDVQSTIVPPVNFVEAPLESDG